MNMMGVIVSEWWGYENLESGHPYDWGDASRGEHSDDNIDFHVDLGAGKLPKGRLTIDSRGDPDILMDLNKVPLPFPNDSIKSIISHHCLEHIGEGFIRLIDECYRVLEPKGKFRIIVPLFPSFSAVTDPDHKRYFTPETFGSFVHNAGPETPFWSESFSTPYTNARFLGTKADITPAESIQEILERKDVDLIDGQYEVQNKLDFIDVDDLFHKPREIRVTLQKP